MIFPSDAIPTIQVIVGVAGQAWLATGVLKVVPPLSNRQWACEQGGVPQPVGRVLRHPLGAGDRRRVAALGTVRGEKLYSRLRAPIVAKQMALLAPLSTNEQELFLDFLMRVVEANHALARPGTGRRKPVRRRETKHQ